MTNFKRIRRQVYLTPFISGVLPTSYLISGYLSQLSYKSKSLRITGFFLSILSYGLTIFLAETFIVKTEIIRENHFLGYTLAITLFIIIQSLLSLVFIFVNRITYKTILANHSEFKLNRTQKINNKIYFISGLLLTTFLFTFGPFPFAIAYIYMLPNIYFYSHLKKLKSTNKYTFIYPAIFLICALSYPVSILIQEQSTYFLGKAISYFGYYFAPFLLYMVIFYLIFDGVKMILKRFKVNPLLTLGSFRFNRSLFLFFAIATILIEIAGSYNFNHPVLNKYEIELKQRSVSANEINIAMAADFHFNEMTKDVFVKRFVEKVNSIDADVVFLVGDIFETSRSTIKINNIKKILSTINSKYGVYAVEGNHDNYSHANNQGFFNDASAMLLRDTVLCIDSLFCIIGRKDRQNRDRIPIAELLKNTSNDLPIIVLDHQPNENSVEYKGIDIYLSGHTHNGQLFPFNLIEKLIYSLPWGYKVINNTHYFVTSGAQGWGSPIKTSAPSEIMQIIAKFKN